MPQFKSAAVAMVVAAGMKYAGYVEALGYDVLTYSRLSVEQLVKQMFLQIGFRI
jgi:hypothetical protein